MHTYDDIAAANTSGGKFLNGAMTGAVITMFNYLGQRRGITQFSGGGRGQAPYGSQEEAAAAAQAEFYGPDGSNAGNLEPGGYIVQRDGGFDFEYNGTPGAGGDSFRLGPRPDGAVASFHGHNRGNADFNFDDINNADGRQLDSWIISRGSLSVYQPGNYNDRYGIRFNGSDWQRRNFQRLYIRE